MSSTYSLEFTPKTERYSCDRCQASNYQYQTFKIGIELSGIYRFKSISFINMYGYLYHENFNLFDSSHNLLVENGKICSTEQISFKFSLILTTYVLVVMTHVPSRTGTFMIQVLERAKLTFTRLCEYLIHYCSLSYRLTLDHTSAYHCCSVGFSSK
jgi:hypothetical protein